MRRRCYRDSPSSCIPSRAVIHLLVCIAVLKNNRTVLLCDYCRISIRCASRSIGEVHRFFESFFYSGNFRRKLITARLYRCTRIFYAACRYRDFCARRLRYDKYPVCIRVLLRHIYRYACRQNIAERPFKRYRCRRVCCKVRGRVFYAYIA